MIDKINPLYTRGLRPVPVIPTVYTDALSYGEQTGIMIHKIDECVDKVNEVVNDNNEFKTELTNRQNTFETNITNQQNTFETNITNQQSSFETAITNQQNTYESTTTSGLNTWKTATKAEYKAQIDGMEAEWDNFIAEYQQVGDFMDTFGDNPIVGVSQKRITESLTAGSIDAVAPNNVIKTADNIDIDPNNYILESGYVASDGSIVSSASHHYFSINLQNVKLIKIRISGTTSGIPLVVLHNSNGYTVGIMLNDPVFAVKPVNIDCDGYDTAYINYFNGITYSVLQYAMNSILSDKTYYPNFKASLHTFGKDDLTLHCGYYDSEFDLVKTTGDSHQHCIIPSKGIKKITIPASSTSANIPAIFVKYNSDSSYQLVGNVLSEQRTYEFDSNGDYEIYINFYQGDYFKTITVEYDNEDKLNDYIKNITTKNTDYTAFGDSIGLGYIDATHTANPNALETATTILNSTLDNQCVSGSSFASVTGYPCIVNKIKSTTISTDNVLIFGGINDWQLGVNASDFKDAIEDACEYLQELNKTVIFITPINHCGRLPVHRPKMSIKDITNIIAEATIKYGFSVIIGMDFDMPTLNSSSTLKALLSEDNLHPTQAGYNLIGQTIGNKLKNA